MNNIMTDSLPRCIQCSSPVTDFIQIEIEVMKEQNSVSVLITHGYAMIVRQKDLTKLLQFRMIIIAFIMNISEMQVSRTYLLILYQQTNRFMIYEDINNCNENGLRHARNSKSNM